MLVINRLILISLTRWISLFVILYKCRAQFWLPGPGINLWAGGLRNIKAVLLLDFAGLQPDQLDNTIGFVKEIYELADDQQTTLWLKFIALNDYHMSYYQFADAKEEDTFLNNLRDDYKRTKEQQRSPKKRKLRLYGNALETAKKILYNEKGQRIVVLITNGKESCTPAGCESCCRSCPQPCDIHECTEIIDDERVRFFVSSEAEQLKANSIMIIIIGVGPNTDKNRLRCWASDGALISLDNYAELPVSGPSMVFNLVNGIRNSAKIATPSTLTSTSTTTTTTVLTSKSTTPIATTTVRTTTPMGSLTATSTASPKDTTVVTSLSATSITTTTTRWGIRNNISKQQAHGITAPSADVKSSTTSQDNNKPSILWMVIGGSLCALITLTIILVVIIVVLRRWRRKWNTSLTHMEEKEPAVRSSGAFSLPRQQHIKAEGSKNPTLHPTTHVRGLSNFRPLPSVVKESVGPTKDSLLLPRRPEGIILGRGPCPDISIPGIRQTHQFDTLRKLGLYK